MAAILNDTASTMDSPVINPYSRPSTVFAAVCAIIFTFVGIAGTPKMA